MASATESPGEVLLTARGLSVSIAGRPLLSDATFELRRGEWVLLVGPSGTGKTVLLKLLAGILRPDRVLRATGQLAFAGRDLIGRGPGPSKVGILFQDHALFDELTPRENLLFALRHRPQAARASGLDENRRAGELLETLGLSEKARIRTMSGGQLQRLALARTLAHDPELVVYDEPTTGLDPANAERVARLIADTHKDGRRTSLVVTHDAHTLAPLADRVLLFDPATAGLREVEADQAEAKLRETLPPDVDAPIKTTPRRGFATAFFERSADCFIAALQSLILLLPLFPRAGYGLRYLWASLKLSASTGAFAYVIMAGSILGFVATYFTFEHLPKKGFTEPVFQDDVVRALGYLMYRVLSPILLTVLIAARNGAAIASYIGGKVYARQFDALRSFGVVPARYLLTANLWGSLIAMPFLFAAFYLCARIFSCLLFIYTHPDRSYFYWDLNFFRSLRSGPGPFYLGTWWLVAKLEVCAFGTAMIAYYQGAREKATADDVSHAVTRTIIAASLFVLTTHFLFAFFEF